MTIRLQFAKNAGKHMRLVKFIGRRDNVEQLPVEKWFDDYLKKEFPSGNEIDIANTPAIDHFIAGWEACVEYFNKAEAANG